MSRPGSGIVESASVILTVAAFASASATLISPRPASAAASGEITCRVFFYYSSPAKTKQVGVFARCPGGAQQGRKTPWFNVETFTIGHPNPPASPQPGSLPCEFLQSGCGNLPVPR